MLVFSKFHESLTNEEFVNQVSMTVKNVETTYVHDILLQTENRIMPAPSRKDKQHTRTHARTHARAKTHTYIKGKLE